MIVDFTVRQEPARTATGYHVHHVQERWATLRLPGSLELSVKSAAGSDAPSGVVLLRCDLVKMHRIFSCEDDIKRVRGDFRAAIATSTLVRSMSGSGLVKIELEC